MAIEDHRFPCDNCGSDLRYDPEATRLVCDHCGNTAPIDTDATARTEAIRELDFRSALDALTSASVTEETRTSHCPSCGASIEFDEDVHA